MNRASKKLSTRKLPLLVINLSYFRRLLVLSQFWWLWLRTCNGKVFAENWWFFSCCTFANLCLMGVQTGAAAQVWWALFIFISSNSFWISSEKFSSWNLHFATRLMGVQLQLWWARFILSELEENTFRRLSSCYCIPPPPTHSPQINFFSLNLSPGPINLGPWVFHFISSGKVFCSSFSGNQAQFFPV